MEFLKLKNNLISVIKEAQIKIGYDSMPISFNYVTTSLRHLLNECDEHEILPLLKQFAQEYKEIFGQIDIAKTDNGYRLTIPEKGVDYVHSILDENEFLVKFIESVRKIDCTIHDVVDIFKSYNENVHFEKTDDNSEFDYLIYFEDGTPDAFWYCLDDDDFGFVYHRFTKEDYLDFHF